MKLNTQSLFALKDKPVLLEKSFTYIEHSLTTYKLAPSQLIYIYTYIGHSLMTYKLEDNEIMVTEYNNNYSSSGINICPVFIPAKMFYICKRYQ